MNTITFCPVATSSGGALAEPDLVFDELAQVARPWLTIVWDDPVNLFSYVEYIFRSYFGYPAEEARRLTAQVDREGKAVVSCGSLEDMQRDVQAMHQYGLQATFTQDIDA